MKCIYFLDLPVYRISQDRYYDEREKHIVKTICGTEICKNEMSESQMYFYNKFRRPLGQRYGGVWEFNEIVGYIKLHFLGGQVRGEYFTTNTKRKVRTRKKLFVYSTHKLAPEINLSRNATNAEIYEKILKYVERCKNELPSSRFIDDKYIKCMGPYIDWSVLIRSTKSEHCSHVY
jgi:hypothetical protein